MTIKIGIAGLGALGGAVAKALLDGIPGYDFIAAAESTPKSDFPRPILSFEELAKQCDLVVECLPPKIVPLLASNVFDNNKNIIIISASALLMFSEILGQHRRSKSRIIVPSGALIGLDGVQALKQSGIKSSRIASTKKPIGFTGAPFIVENNIDLSAITTRKMIFSGNALEAAKAFPANVNVAATLSLAGIGPEKTMVEIWADPDAPGNTHEITVEGHTSRISARVENLPDPKNPKSSMLAAHSIIAVLKGQTEPLAVL